MKTYVANGKTNETDIKTSIKKHTQFMLPADL